MHSPDKLVLPIDSADKKRYYKIQLRAWASFDPSTMDLLEIAHLIERGEGLVTAIEVVKTADGINAIDDVDVRERFESIEAVQRVMANIGDIPKPLLQKLYSALNRGRDEDATSLAA